MAMNGFGLCSQGGIIRKGNSYPMLSSFDEDSVLIVSISIPKVMSSKTLIALGSAQDMMPEEVRHDKK